MRSLEAVKYWKTESWAPSSSKNLIYQSKADDLGGLFQPQIILWFCKNQSENKGVESSLFLGRTPQQLLTWFLYNCITGIGNFFSLCLVRILILIEVTAKGKKKKTGFFSIRNQSMKSIKIPKVSVLIYASLLQRYHTVILWRKQHPCPHGMKETSKILQINEC